MRPDDYKLSACGIYTWERKGTDYHNPKYRALLENSVGAFLGLILALLLNELSESAFPSLYILPPIAIAYAIYAYAYYRTKKCRKSVMLRMKKMSYTFDFANKQIVATTDDGKNPVPLFAPDGFVRVDLLSGRFLMTGCPNIDLIFMLEENSTDYSYPSYAYRNFTVELTAENNDDIREIVRRFEAIR